MKCHKEGENCCDDEKSEPAGNTKVKATEKKPAIQSKKVL